MAKTVVAAVRSAVSGKQRQQAVMQDRRPGPVCRQMLLSVPLQCGGSCVADKSHFTPGGSAGPGQQTRGSLSHTLHH